MGSKDFEIADNLIRQGAIDIVVIDFLLPH